MHGSSLHPYQRFHIFAADFIFLFRWQRNLSEGRGSHSFVDKVFHHFSVVAYSTRRWNEVSKSTVQNLFLRRKELLFVDHIIMRAKLAMYF